MNCDMARDRLWAWVHDEADPADCAGIEAHVAGCEACRDEVAEMRGILGELNQIGITARKPETVKIPESIQGYKILRRIAQGGMGVVYEAEQQRPQRRVALKLILGGAHADDLQIRMFEREMQALARLNHPGIAAIHDAGRTDEGQSFYTMELVEGIDLLAYLRKRDEAGISPQHDLRTRVQLFCEICDAISYAHQRGIIHRDLKPSNVLITAEGRPKVLDFGLARAAERDGTVPTINTASGRLMGTLPYMSPEQAQGLTDAVDVRTDLYSLGVMLYEILTGHLPYDVSRLSVVAAVKVICEQTPTPPARVMDHVPSDLSVITMKALEKEADRRYAGVAALAEDLRRYLGGHPILARPASTIYQLKKLVSRHRVPAALGAALVLSIVGAGFWMYFDAARETRRIRRLNDNLVKFYMSSDPWQFGSRDTRVYDLIGEAAKSVDRDLGDEPLVAASMRHTLGNIFKSFNDYMNADGQFREALRIRTELLGETHPETLETQRMLGENCFLRGEREEAESIFRRGAEAERARQGPPNERIAVNLNNLGLVMKTGGKLANARELYLDALSQRQAILSELQQASGVKPELLRDARLNVAETLNNLGALAREERRLDQAKTYYLESMQIRLEALGEVHPDIQKSYNNYAKLLYDLGEYEEAERYFRKVIAILRQGLGEEHVFIAKALHSLALTLRAQQRLGESEAECRAALDMRRRLVAEGKVTPGHADLSDSLCLLADLMILDGNAAGALPLYEESLEISRSSRGEDDWRTALIESAMGGCLMELGRIEASGPLLLRSAELLLVQQGKDAVETKAAERRLEQYRRAMDARE